MKNSSIKILSALSLSLIVQSALAGGVITGINVSSLNADQKIVKIVFSGDVVNPRGFASKTPPRLALDFPDTQLRTASSALQYRDPVLQEIALASDGSRARVALDLRKDSRYRLEKRGHEIWVFLTANNSSVSAPQNSQPSFKVSNTTINNDSDKIGSGSNQYQTATLNISTKTIGVSKGSTTTQQQTQPPLQAYNVTMNFLKNRMQAGVVTLNVPVKHPVPKIQKMVDRIVVTFPNMPLQGAAQRDFDVSEFGTPIKKVSLLSVGNDTQVTLFTGGTWDVDTKNEVNQYVITVSPRLDLFDSTLDTQPKQKHFTGKKVSLDFQNVDVRTILQLLAKVSGLNIVASDRVGGKMTLSLKDVPWDQALDYVMQANGLGMRRQGNIISIMPRTDLVSQDRQILKDQQELNNLGPLSSRTFRLKYKSVDDFKTMLNSVQGSNGANGTTNNSILGPRGSIMIDPATNTLIVTDTTNVLNKFQKLVDQLDIPVRQVMIEARIVEVKEDVSRQLGAKFGWDASSNIGGTINGGDNSGNINLPSSGGGLGSYVGIVRSVGSHLLNLQINALQTEGEAKDIASPRVLTQDRQAAQLEDGVDIPYQKSTSSGATATEFKKAVTGLNVTPQITPDGNVIMKLDITKNTPAGPGGAMNVKHVNTTAMVENGGTIVIGGIYSENSSKNDNGVPVLQDIPIVGNLFKMRNRQHTRSEMLIFITPHIIDNSNKPLNY